VARPMPLLPPVMTATFPDSLLMFVSFLYCNSLGSADAAGSKKLFAGEPCGASEARKTAIGAMSPTRPVRPNGAWAIIAFSKSEPSMPPVCVPSVSTMPGLIVLTRIFLGPNSRASTPVIASNAPLVPE